MNNFKDDIEACLKLLHNGGVIIYPTDTIWGIGCDATNEMAVQKIIELKQRTNNKSFVVLVADEKQLMQYVASLDLEVFNYLDSQKNATTVIYPLSIGLADNVLAADGSVAIRICKDEFCKTLIKRFRKPLVSTSANITNQPVPENFAAINTMLLEQVDYVVQYRQQETTTSKPSNIIQWINGEVVLVR
jgi:L-threonylcarbamoyladenylate synthase